MFTTAKLVGTAAIVAGALILTGCSTYSAGSTASSTAAPASGQQKATVSSVSELKAAYFTAGSSNTYLQAGIDSAKEYAASQGFPLDVFDGQFDAQVQIDQIQSAITSGKYNAFAIEALDGNLVCNSVKEAATAGIMVSAVGAGFCGRSTNSVDNMFEPGTVTIVNGQSLDIYKSWVEQVKKDYPDGAKIAIITGPSLSAYTVIMADAAKNFSEKDGYTVVAQQATDYTTDKAFSTAQTIMQSNPDLDVIMSNYSGMSRGVVQATAGSKVAVYDFGGDAWALENVASGALTSTIMMLPRETKYAFEAIVDLVSGKTAPKVYDLATDPSLPHGTPFVYQSNVADYTAEY